MQLQDPAWWPVRRHAVDPFASIVLSFGRIAAVTLRPSVLRVERQPGSLGGAGKRTDARERRQHVDAPVLPRRQAFPRVVVADLRRTGGDPAPVEILGEARAEG